MFHCHSVYVMLLAYTIQSAISYLKSRPCVSVIAPLSKRNDATDEWPKTGPQTHDHNSVNS